MKNQWILHASDVLDVLVGVLVSWTTLLWIDDPLRLWCREVGLGLPKKTNMEILVAPSGVQRSV